MGIMTGETTLVFCPRFSRGQRATSSSEANENSHKLKYYFRNRGGGGGAFIRAVAFIRINTVCNSVRHLK